jgi:arylsulfatase A-like enzyme
MGGTSGAVCMPSRAMLLCGRTLFHLDNKGASIPRAHIMLPELLRQKGYRTFGTGKWHNGKRAYARCFEDGGKILFGGMNDHMDLPVYDFDPKGEYPQESRYQEKTFSSVLFSNQAIKFLEGYASDEPFFLYVSYTAPHDPRMAPEDFTAMYKSDKIPLPENFMPEHPFDNGELDIRDENLAPHPRTPEVIRKHIASYYAMISHLDFHIGRVLETLKRTGKADNTIIVFTGDNGLAVGQHGLLGKQNLYDHSVRVPLIFSGPGIPRNKVTDALCYLLDIYPTLCDLLGYSAPLSVEGSSLKDIINGKKEKIRERVFLAYRHLQRGLRTVDNWKLIKYHVSGKETTQLFNLNDDPWELNNLANDTSYQQRLKELTALLQADMEALDDFCSLDKPDWGLSE